MSNDYELGYKQAQIDILRMVLKEKVSYLTSDTVNFMRSVLGFDPPEAAPTDPAGENGVPL